MLQKNIRTVADEFETRTTEGIGLDQEQPDYIPSCSQTASVKDYAQSQSTNRGTIISSSCILTDS